MLENLGKITEFLTKASPRISAAAFLFCIATRVLPRRALAWLGIASVIESHETALGLTFLGTGAILATYPLHALWKLGAQYRLKARALRAGKNRLHRLTVSEKKLLQLYAVNQTRTRRLNLGSGVAGGLVQEGILFHSSNVGSQIDGLAYNIQSWAYDYIVERPELVATPGDTSELDAFE